MKSRNSIQRLLTVKASFFNVHIFKFLCLHILILYLAKNPLITNDKESPVFLNCAHIIYPLDRPNNFDLCSIMFELHSIYLEFVFHSLFIFVLSSFSHNATVFIKRGLSLSIYTIKSTTFTQHNASWCRTFLILLILAVLYNVLFVKFSNQIRLPGSCSCSAFRYIHNSVTWV